MLAAPVLVASIGAQAQSTPATQVAEPTEAKKICRTERITGSVHE